MTGEGSGTAYRVLERGVWGAHRTGVGDRGAVTLLCDATRALVTRMCRAELAPALGVPAADSVAAGVLPVAIAAVLSDRARSPLRVVYTETVLGVEAVRPYVTPPGPMDGLARHERDVLVLRTAVGLSAVQAGEALGCSVEQVHRDQHSALQKLRNVRVCG